MLDQPQCALVAKIRDNKGMTSQAQPGQTAGKNEAAFKRYKIMAFITGGMLLLLCAEMFMKYVLKLNGDEPVIGTWIAIIHGWIYVIYVITVFDVWSRMRWGFGRIVAMIAGGVVPVLSFVMEAKAERWFKADNSR